MGEVGVIVAGVLNAGALLAVGAIGAHTRAIVKRDVIPTLREVDHAVNDKPRDAATISETVDQIHRVVTDPRASPLAREIHEEHEELIARLKDTIAPQERP